MYVKVVGILEHSQYSAPLRIFFFEKKKRFERSSNGLGSLRIVKSYLILHILVSQEKPYPGLSKSIENAH